MIGIFQAFHEGGIMMWVILLWMLAGIPTSIVAVVMSSKPDRKPAQILGLVGLALGLLAIGSGIVGYAWGMSMVHGAIAAAAPEYRAQLLEVGTREAMNNVWFGGIAAVIPIAASAVALAKTSATSPST